MSILIMAAANTLLPDGTKPINQPAPSQPGPPPAPVTPPPVTPPCPAITVTPTTLPSGTVGVAYSQQLAASGGTGPYTFTASGVLPAGVSVSSAGLVSGTPTQAATTTMAVRATDSRGCFATLIASVLIAPVPPILCPTITIAPQAFPMATVGTAYSQQFTASGGQAPYVFTSPTLPAGLAISSSGLLSGTATTAVSFMATVNVTDANGCPASVSALLIVQPAPPPPPPPVPPTPVPPGAQRILGQADISYVGCFRMPPGTDTRFSYGNLSGRVVNGQTHLFVYGINPILGDPVYEIVDPGVYSHDYHTAPSATLYANWGDIYHGKRITFDGSGNPQPVGQQIPGGLYWNEATQLLYWTYYNSYNVSGFPDWGLGASQLVDPIAGTSYSYGPWRTRATDADGKTWYGPWRCLYLWPNLLDGSFLCGSSIQSGASAAPWGPDMYGGIPWPTATTPTGPSSANDLILTKRWLESYFMGDPNAPNRILKSGALVGHLRSFRRRTYQALYEQQGLQVDPAQNGGVGSFGQCDRTHGAIWLQLTNVRGILFSNTLSGAVSQLTTDPLAGHCWYSNAGVNPPIGACSHGIAPPVPITGPVTTAAFPAWAIYNPDDLAAVMNTANDYTPEPTSVINLEAAYGVQTAPINTVGAAKSLEGFYFDPVRKYLFAVAHGVDHTQGPYFVTSIIHVFAIHDVP